MIASRKGGDFQRQWLVRIGHLYRGGEMLIFSANHLRGERGPSGIMIWRRPKRRASSEKAKQDKRRGYRT
jgi:hypothetical protein